MNADLGNYADALEHYLHAIDLASKLNDNATQFICFNNLGVALLYAGLYSDAALCFQKAESFQTEGCEIAIDRGTAPGNLAQCLFFLGALDKAFAAISRAIAVSVQPSDSSSALLRTIREHTYVRIALELGHFKQAKLHSAECAKYAEQSGSIRATLHAETSAALYEIYAGDVENGVEKLERVVGSLPKKGGYSDVLALLATAYDRAGRHTEALFCLRKLIKDIRQARSTATSTLLASSQLTTTAQNEADLRELKYIEADLRARVAEEQRYTAQIEMLERLAVAADLKEDISGQHGCRVGRLAWLIGKDLNWSRPDRDVLETCARLHDIGKIGLPDRLLLASTDLRAAQREFMKAHTSIGGELLSKSNIAFVRAAEDVARYHHEWWNGQGYPTKLSGKRIPIHARIVALADVFDALTHGRPYAEAWPFERAREEILSRRGTQFDPELTDCFISVIDALHEEHPELDAFLLRSIDSPFSQTRQKIRALLAAQEKQSQSTEEAAYT